MVKDQLWTIVEHPYIKKKVRENIDKIKTYKKKDKNERYSTVYIVNLL